MHSAAAVVLMDCTTPTGESCIKDEGSPQLALLFLLVVAVLAVIAMIVFATVLIRRWRGDQTQTIPSGRRFGPGS